MFIRLSYNRVYQQNMFSKLKITPQRFYTVIGLIIIGLGIVLNFARVWFSSTTVDADSSIVGLMGTHILHGKDFPIFFYGQAYMGSLEAIVAAIYFLFLGISASSLYLVSTTFWGLYVVVNFFVVQRVFGTSRAVVACIFLAFPTAYLSDRLFRTWGGYMEMLFFGSLVLLLSLSITDRLGLSRAVNKPFALLGLIVGLGLWTHFSIIFYIATAIFLFVSSGCIKKITLRDLSYFLIFLIIGFSPVLIYNIWPVAFSNILHYPLLNKQSGQTWDYLFAQGQPFKVRILFGFNNLATVLKVSLPLILGAQIDAGFYLLPTLSKGLLLFYLTVSAWLVFQKDKLFRALLNFNFPSKSELFRLYPVFLGVFAVISYCFGNFAYSFGDPRYLLALYSVFPVLAADFLYWVWSKNVTLSVLLFVFIFINHIYPVYGMHPDIPVFSRRPTNESRLIEELQKIKATRVYAGYPIGFPITFATSEQIIASPKYGPFNLNRYPEYTELVDRAINPTYVFPTDINPDYCCEASFSAVLKKESVDYKFLGIKGYNVYYNLSEDIRPLLSPDK